MGGRAISERILPDPDDPGQRPASRRGHVGGTVHLADGVTAGDGANVRPEQVGAGTSDQIHAA
jgi:hypothetical protein